MRAKPWLWLVCLPWLSGFTCGHPQAEGTYTWAVDTAADGGGVIRDPCHLVSNPAQLASGNLQVIGDTARIDNFTFGGYQLQMVGSFEYGIEIFTMDGSAANVPATVSGQSCSIDMASIHFDATTDDPTHFHGGLRVFYDVPSFPACQCEAEVVFRASQP